LQEGKIAADQEKTRSEIPRTGAGREKHFMNEIVAVSR